MANLIEMDLPAIQGMDDILKPSDRPVMGNQRLVRFLPVPGTKKLFPCIWISPYITKEILGIRAQQVLLGATLGILRHRNHRVNQDHEIRP